MGATYLVLCSSITNDLEYDFIVVGVGSGGSIMAARLSEPDNNWTVLALDRGSAHDTKQQEEIDGDLSGVFDPNYFSVPQNYLLGRVVRNPRYYGIGGIAMINGMTVVAPSRHLLDQLWPSGKSDFLEAGGCDSIFPSLMSEKTKFLKAGGVNPFFHINFHKQGGMLHPTSPLYLRSCTY